MSWSILDRCGSGQFEKREPHGPGARPGPAGEPRLGDLPFSLEVTTSRCVPLPCCLRTDHCHGLFARFPNVDYLAQGKCLDVVISLKDARLAVAWTFWPPPSFDNVDLVCMRGIQRKSAAVGNGGQQFYPYFEEAVSRLYCQVDIPCHSKSKPTSK